MLVEAHVYLRLVGGVTALMSGNVEQTIAEGLRILAPEQQRKVAAFVKKSRIEKSLWQRIDEPSREVLGEV
jgi:hypothetical protein